MRKRQLLAVSRHGHSDANAALAEESEDALYYSVAGCDRNVGLTRLGVMQGTASGDIIRGLLTPDDDPFESVFCTRFRRVRRSTNLIVKRLPNKPKVKPDNRLNKRLYGDFWNLTRRGVELLHPDEWLRYQAEGDFLYRPPNGENYPDLFHRVDDFIADEVTESSGNILVVTHSVVVLAFMRALEGLSDAEVVQMYEDITLPNGVVVLYERTAENPVWKRIAMCAPDVSI